MFGLDFHHVPMGHRKEKETAQEYVTIDKIILFNMFRLVCSISGFSLSYDEILNN